MKLTVLGMNGPYPAPGSACSGSLVTEDQDALQLDLGTGTLQALTGRVAPEALSGLLLSHWHYDHASDILPLTYRMADACAKGCGPLHVWGPVDEHSFIREAVKACPQMVLHDICPGDSFSIGCFSIQAFEARHPVPALMYRITASGKVLCYTGDTNTVDGLERFADSADLLLADGLFTDAAWAEGKPHLSARHTAVLASRAHAKKLVITHLNPSLDAATLLKEAREAYPSAELAACGQSWNV